MTEKLANLIDNLSTQPGCYLMHDKNDNIIYVGKAKNLKNRVSQYFLRPQSGKVAAMVSNVDYFETIVTKNEAEAFLLEYNLIHKYLPFLMVLKLIHKSFGLQEFPFYKHFASFYKLLLFP